MTINKIDSAGGIVEVRDYLEAQKDDAYFTITIKRWRERRTITQNNFFHLLCDHLGHRLGMDPALVKEGIKQQHGYKERFGDVLVPKPSSMCNKFEEMSALIEGCFIEAGEQGVDMREFIAEWEEYKKQERDKL